MAADAAHAKQQQSLSDDYAFLDSPGSGVVVATLKSKAMIWAGFAQVFLQAGPIFKIGCYKEQQFLVDPATFAATQTTIGCPG